MAAASARYSTLPVPLSRATAPALELNELTKRFASRRGLRDVLRGHRASMTTAVDRVSFTVDTGEIFGLLGPNGAGKTTIFKMLSSMVLPDGGKARAFGNDLDRRPAVIRRLLAAVPADERSLNWRLSAHENLLLFAALHRVPRHDVRRRIDALLAVVGLETTGRKMVGAFSSGMRQRLLIARALISAPRILLLDEPTRALDPMSAREFRLFLRSELVARERCTIVLATHNTDEALGFCDRVVVLNQGRALAEGTATELAARFGEERYRLLTLDPEHEVLSALEQRGLLRRLGPAPATADAWHVVECAISGDPSRSARVLQLLIEGGVRVARLERVETSLADLIGRIIRASSEASARA